MAVLKNDTGSFIETTQTETSSINAKSWIVLTRFSTEAAILELMISELITDGTPPINNPPWLNLTDLFYEKYCVLTPIIVSLLTKEGGDSYQGIGLLRFQCKSEAAILSQWLRLRHNTICPFPLKLTVLRILFSHVGIAP